MCLALCKNCMCTDSKVFRNSVSKAIQPDEFVTPEHVDVAYSQSGKKFGFKTLVSDLGQGSNSYLETVKLMFSSKYGSRFYNKEPQADEAIIEPETFNQGRYNCLAGMGAIHHPDTRLSTQLPYGRMCSTTS